MAYNKKKYIRINWKNRPSTATALGATNLNHMDVFLNDVDNALIEMDSGKLNVETANSMIASITFDKDKGLMTVRELNGTTYTYDWNVEKIPVSFSLSEDGILTMTTQDGTQFTANIADLIKDYVFDDSDTIAFTKEFQTEDNSYHVGASVKNGSIKAEHLDPDYRTDIQNFSNVAQTAANDALTYSKDSKRWAVGDASYEGSETDNSKYYKEQAENARDAAEKARDEAQAATGAVIMAPGVLGVGKPDNTTIKVTEDGTMSVPKATSDSYGLVKPDNTTIGQEDGAIRLIAKAASLLVTDTQGFVGDKNSETNVQLLIDAIADKMVKQLVSNSALTQQLANYVAKSMMSNIQVNDTDKVPTSALAYAMQQAITANANGITQLNNNLKVSYIPYIPVFSWSDGGANPTVQNMDVAYVVFSKICFVYARYNITDLGKSDRSKSFLSISLPKEIEPIAYNAAIISSYYQISNEYTPLGVRIENKIIYIVNGIGGDHSGPHIKTGYQGFSVFFMCK